MMSFLFWILWVFNLLLLVLTVAGKNFRSGFGTGIDLNIILMVFLLLVLVTSLLFRFSAKPKWISLAIIGLPLVVLLFWYSFEKITGRT
jgi:hypothetical protein